ncbi:hypothetical protein D3OALGA1CA_4674 [Olavius algarvensis associated proteobacterium Delta 3]|nr:hypothetical protein D3OALGB2SA_4864 [Olavius algarvensis associated proteobacterium Delta 3]CAB5155132.1 hypothetical protein D3OALGA1CA_4674 [Olavius algarvensis associated proteobacterium Delta 3]
MGYMLLEGGAEFNGRMADADRRAMALAGGEDARISIIPAAAAPDNNQLRAGNNGVRWFRKLGALQVEALPLVDGITANDPAISGVLRQSHLIFIPGGFPGYLADTLKGSLCWRAVTEAEHAGGVIAGSSAGAMVLCEYFYDPSLNQVARGLNRIHGACVIPHHDTYCSKWVRFLQDMLPDTTLVGIAEQTGMINEGRKGAWHVYGKGDVTLYRKGHTERFTRSQTFQIR